jgi:hypothetical protein
MSREKHYREDDLIEKLDDSSLASSINAIKTTLPHHWERIGKHLRSRCFPFPVDIDADDKVFKNAYLRSQTYAQIATKLGFFEDNKGAK